MAQDWKPRYLSTTESEFTVRYPNIDTVVTFKVARRGNVYQTLGTDQAGRTHWYGPDFETWAKARYYWVCFRHGFQNGYGLEMEAM